eukprot:1864948-Pyramimonas_sp.AAC.1
MSPNLAPGHRFATTTTTKIISRRFAHIRSRAIKYAYPKPWIPALFVFDRAPLGGYITSLRRVVGKATKPENAGEMRKGDNEND